MTLTRLLALAERAVLALEGIRAALEAPERARQTVREAFSLGPLTAEDAAQMDRDIRQSLGQS